MATIENKLKNYVLTVEKQTTPDEVINSWQRKLPQKETKMTVEEFMDVVSDASGKTNRDVIWSFYDALEKKVHESEYSSKKLPFIKAGTQVEFPIPKSPIQIEDVADSKSFLVQGEFSSYWSENLKKLVLDPNFVPDNVVGSDESIGLSTKMQSINVRVWIYCKATDSIYDISQYILTCSTAKTLQRGSFSVTTIPFRNDETNLFGGSYYDNFNTVTKEGYSTRSFLEKVVSVNDVVFIRFERLKLEKERNSSNKSTIKVDVNKLANTGSQYNVWDMIGFVDSCNEVYSAEDNSKMTIINGRDLSKVFEEDGSYFIPLQDVDNGVGEEHWTPLGRPQDSWYKRNVITGSYDYLWSYKYKRIHECIWFIINIMSNIGVCKDSLFASWGTKRLTSYNVEGQEPMSVSGIWQIVKCFVDNDVQSRVLVDSSIGNPNGTLMDYMNRICQYPFVDFSIDTYINTIDIVVRQPPFTEKAIMSAYSNKEYVIITPDNVISYDLSYDSRIYTWFQIHIQNNSILGDKEQVGLAFVPIVYLNEYVELWGNRKLEVNDIYATLRTVKGVQKEEDFSTMQAALINDLIYVVESNAYIPFTRTGTIELNGDRRIKAGTFIVNQATDEFFYVTSVSNSVAFTGEGIDRRTILQVERGMYIPILESTETKSVKRLDNTFPTVKGKPSYFKIVDLSELKRSAKEAEQGKLTTASSPRIDKDMFEYFLNRKMFGGL